LGTISDDETPMSLPHRLHDGYRAFRAGRLQTEQSRYRELAERGQTPETMVIGCCDSRVSPEVIFDASPGELFVVRNVANLVPPYETTPGRHGVSAALEYAVEVLKVKHIVVLGHARCGGIQAFAEPGAPLSAGDFIGSWMSLISTAADRAGPRNDTRGPYLTRLEQASLVNTLDNLETFPFIRAKVASGEIVLHAAYFDVSTGDLLAYNATSGGFQLVDQR
jgi:carbonic anhydrase